MLPTYFQVWDHLLELGGLTWDHTSKETNFPCPRSQTVRSFSVRGGSSHALSCPMLPCRLAWSCDCLPRAATNASSSGMQWSCPVQKHCLLWSSLTSDPHSLSILYSEMVPEPCREGMLHMSHLWISALLMSISVPCPLVSFWVNYCPLQKEKKFLCWCLRAAFIYG